MNWLAILSLIFQYGPALFTALAALFTAIKARNPTQGAKAISQGAQIAKDVTLALKARTDLTNDQKRDQAWQDIQTLGALAGTAISESEARTLAELSYQDAR